MKKALLGIFFIFMYIFLLTGCNGGHSISAANGITAYSLNGNIGVITGQNIAVTVPNGTNVTALIATFTTAGTRVTVGNVAQASGVTPNNFTSPVVYTVSNETGRMTYTVTVTVAPSSAKAITAYSLNGTIGVISGQNIAVTMPNGTNVTALIATFTTTGVGVSVGGVTQTSAVTPNDFTSPVTYIVTAADGSTASYTVTVTVAPIQLKYAYITNFNNNSYTQCTVNGTDGILSGCNTIVPTGLGALNGPSDITID